MALDFSIIFCFGSTSTYIFFINSSFCLSFNQCQTVHELLCSNYISWNLFLLDSCAKNLLKLQKWSNIIHAKIFYLWREAEKTDQGTFKECGLIRILFQHSPPCGPHLLPLVLQCFDLIRWTSLKQQIWHHYMNISINKLFNPPFYIYIYI